MTAGEIQDLIRIAKAAKAYVKHTDGYPYQDAEEHDLWLDLELAVAMWDREEEANSQVQADIQKVLDSFTKPRRGGSP